MMAAPHITDRAKRYRAERNVRGPRKCVICGSTSDIQVMHLSGNEDDGERANLAHGCRSCNQKLSAAFKRIGAGRPTNQYNPAKKGIPTFEQYMWAVTHHNRGAHDEGGVIIHATPKHKRIEYARRIADVKRGRFEERYNPWPFSRPDARRTTPATGGIAHHMARARARGSAAPAGSYKGYKIGRTAEGEFYSSLDPASLFETKRGATSLIDSYLKGRANPSKFYVVDPERTYKTYPAATLAAARSKAAKLAKQHYSSVEIREYIPGDPFGRRVESVGGNPAKFDRCVKEVKARGGDVNAYAVCTAAGTRNPGLRFSARQRSDGQWDIIDHERGDVPRVVKTKSAARQALASMNARGLRFTPSSGRRRRNAAPEIGGRDFRGGYDLDKKLDALNDQMSRVSITSKKWGALNKRKDALLKKISAEFRGNPAAASADVFEEFHGFKPSEVVTVTKKIHHHQHLASLGVLVFLEVWGVDKAGHTVDGFKGAILASNEDRNQLFIEGGDQSVNLRDYGIRTAHEMETLGKVLTVGYDTNKKHLGSEGGKAVYVHDFTTTNRNGKHVKVPAARLPQLIYDVRNEQLLFSGGSYEIIREGIDK